MNKVLVTGGLGIIGAYVCRALFATSRQPVIYDLYFKMATEEAQAEIGFKPLFNYRLAAIDYAATLERLKRAIS